MDVTFPARKRVSDDAPRCVYGMLDPRCGIVRYVGQCVNVRIRITSHISFSPNPFLARWIASLVADGVRPQGVVLEFCESKHAAIDREKYWIAHYYSQIGHELLNLDGIPNFIGVHVLESQANRLRRHLEEKAVACARYLESRERYAHTHPHLFTGYGHFIFTNDGYSRNKGALAEHLGICRGTLNKRLAKIPPELIHPGPLDISLLME